MELVILFGALLILDIVAPRWGYDSRESHAIAHYERALDGARGLDMALYRDELARMDGDLAARGWPRS